MAFPHTVSGLYRREIHSTARHLTRNQASQRATSGAVPARAMWGRPRWISPQCRRGQAPCNAWSSKDPQISWAGMSETAKTRNERREVSRGRALVSAYPPEAHEKHSETAEQASPASAPTPHGALATVYGKPPRLRSPLNGYCAHHGCACSPVRPALPGPLSVSQALIA